MLKHLRTLPAILLMAVVVLLSGISLSFAPVIAQTTTRAPRDNSIAPVLNESYADAEKRPSSDPYKVPPLIGDGLPPNVRTSPLGQYYECNVTPTIYPEAEPKPEDQMSCSDGRYPQKFLFERPVIEHPIAPNTPEPKKQGAQPNAIKGTDNRYRYYVAFSPNATSSGVQSGFTFGNTNYDLADADVSEAQIAIQSSGGSNVVEIGWEVYYSFYKDKKIHLLVSRYVNGQFNLANGANSGFVATYGGTVTPGQVLTPGGSATLAIVHRIASEMTPAGSLPSRWAVTYNGVEFGYFPDSLWAGAFVQGAIINVQGEVVSFVGTGTCTDMGNGNFGTSPSSTKFFSLQYFSASGASKPYPYVASNPTDPGLYNRSSLTEGAPISGFNYGGTGTTKCAPTANAKPVRADS